MRSEPGQVQGAPEAVATPGKVMALGGRPGSEKFSPWSCWPTSIPASTAQWLQSISRSPCRVVRCSRGRASTLGVGRGIQAVGVQHFEAALGLDADVIAHACGFGLSSRRPSINDGQPRGTHEHTSPIYLTGRGGSQPGRRRVHGAARLRGGARPRVHVQRDPSD